MSFPFSQPSSDKELASEDDCVQVQTSLSRKRRAEQRRRSRKLDHTTVTKTLRKQHILYVRREERKGRGTWKTIKRKDHGRPRYIQKQPDIDYYRQPT